MIVRLLSLLVVAGVSLSAAAKKAPEYPLGELPVTPVSLLPFQVAAAEQLERTLQERDRLSAWYELKFPEDYEEFTDYSMEMYDMMKRLADGEVVYHEGYQRYLVVAMEHAPADDPTCAAYEGLVAQTYHQPVGDNWFRVGLRFCPYFMEKETHQQKVETVIHELVHAVRGPGECMAYMLHYMAVALANDHYYLTPNSWKGYRCEEGGFFLPLGVDYTENHFKKD